MAADVFRAIEKVRLSRREVDEISPWEAVWRRTTRPCGERRRQRVGHRHLADTSASGAVESVGPGKPGRGQGWKQGVDPRSWGQRAAACYVQLHMLHSSSMARVITQRELRNDSGAVLREVQAGRTLLITRNGVPVAELRPVSTRRFAPRALIADAARWAPRVDAARFRADLDAVIDQSVHG